MTKNDRQKSLLRRQKSLLRRCLKKLRYWDWCIEASELILAIEKAPAKAKIAIEKERQKTADKQRKANEALQKANEALLPTVKVFQCPNDKLNRMRFKRKF